VLTDPATGTEDDVGIALQPEQSVVIDRLGGKWLVGVLDVQRSTSSTW
jgi:hypothetical protein